MDALLAFSPIWATRFGDIQTIAQVVIAVVGVLVAVKSREIVRWFWSRYKLMRTIANLEADKAFLKEALETAHAGNKGWQDAIESFNHRVSAQDADNARLTQENAMYRSKLIDAVTYLTKLFMRTDDTFKTANPLPLTISPEVSQELEHMLKLRGG